MVRTQDLRKHYRSGGSIIRAVSDVTFSINRGEFVAIVGRSGSGKSTLMSLLGLLERADAGQYMLNGSDVGRLHEDARAAMEPGNRFRVPASCPPPARQRTGKCGASPRLCRRTAQRNGIAGQRSAGTCRSRVPAATTGRISSQAANSSVSRSPAPHDPRPHPRRMDASPLRVRAHRQAGRRHLPRPRHLAQHAARPHAALALDAAAPAGPGRRPAADAADRTRGAARPRRGAGRRAGAVSVGRGTGRTRARCARAARSHPAKRRRPIRPRSCRGCRARSRACCPRSRRRSQSLRPGRCRRARWSAPPARSRH